MSLEIIELERKEPEKIIAIKWSGKEEDLRDIKRELKNLYPIENIEFTLQRRREFPILGILRIERSMGDDEVVYPGEYISITRHDYYGTYSSYANLLCDFKVKESK